MKRVLAVGVLSLMSAVSIAQVINGGDIGSSSTGVSVSGAFREEVITEADLFNRAIPGIDSVTYENFTLSYKINGSANYDQEVFVPDVMKDELAKNFCRIATGGDLIEFVGENHVYYRFVDKFRPVTILDRNINILRSNVAELSRKLPQSNGITLLQTIVCSRTKPQLPPNQAQIK